MSASSETGTLKSKKGAAVINEIHTHVVCTNFSNKLFIAVTQFCKLGTLVLVTRDVALEEQTGTPTYSTKVLFGKDEEMIHVVTRNLASKIPVEKPIVFSFAMKDMSVPTLRATEQLVLRHAVWCESG